jgi:hypothetical protein
MTPKYKLDAFKRCVTEMKGSTVFSQPEQFNYFLGLRSACKILAGDTAGVTKFMGNSPGKPCGKRRIGVSHVQS